MPTKISLEGILEDADGYVHLVPKEVWYCSETPQEALKILARTHKIHEYKCLQNPFSIREYGLNIILSRVPRKKVPCLRDLMYQINKMRIYHPESRTFRGGWFGDYQYNPSSLRYSPLLRKPQTWKRLKNLFVKSLDKRMDGLDWHIEIKTAQEILEVLSVKNPREYLKNLEKAETDCY